MCEGIQLMLDQYAFIHVHTEAIVARVRAYSQREAVHYFTVAARRGCPIEGQDTRAQEHGILFFDPDLLGQNFLARIERETADDRMTR
jgi:hypothetical protein